MVMDKGHKCITAEELGKLAKKSCIEIRKKYQEVKDCVVCQRIWTKFWVAEGDKCR